MASLTAKVKATDWLTIQARGNVDYTSDKNEQKIWASTSTTLTGGNWEGGTDNGRYVYGMGQDFMAYGDVMAMFNKTWNDWSLNAVLGASATYNKSNSLSIDSRLAGLHNPNVFTITNINYTAGTGMNVTNKARSTSESIFATAQIGWKEALYLDLSARNDWASTLYGTTSDKKGFFYPSVGLSWLINNSLNMPEWISMAKVRGSYAKVGNSLPLYMANLQPSISIGGGINQVVNYNDGTLKPEMTTSYEAGAELKLLGYRLDVDFTWYKTETRNQFLLVPMLPGSAYAYKMINAGKINNQGIELTVGGVPVQTPEFRWRTQVNFSTNSNKVVKLADGFTQFQYGGAGLNMSYRMFVKEGGSLGDLYGRTYERDDNGSILFGNDGLPLVADGYNYVGNSNPKYNLGWSNSFSYKGFNLNLLIDGVIGGKVMSITQAMLDEAGVSANVGKALDRGYVELEGKKINDVKAFYAKVGGRQGISENYMYKRTNFRLRELSLGYSFPQRMMERTNFFKDITVSFVARNLFFLYKDAPFDPDALMSVGNANQGVDVFCLPTTQSFGFNVKFQF